MGESNYHWENCSAPICNDEKAYDQTPNWRDEVVWRAGEPMCSKGHKPWQKKQEWVNRVLAKGELAKEKLDRPFTVSELMKL